MLRLRPHPAVAPVRAQGRSRPSCPLTNSPILRCRMSWQGWRSSCSKHQSATEGRNQHGVARPARACNPPSLPLYDRAPCPDFTSPNRPPGRATNLTFPMSSCRPPAASPGRKSAPAHATWKIAPPAWCACSTTSTRPWDPGIRASMTRTCRSACATCCTRASSTTACSVPSARERSPSTCAPSARKPCRWRRPWRCSPATCCSRRTASRAHTWFVASPLSNSCASCCPTRATCARAGSCPSCTTGRREASSRSPAI